MIFAALLAVSLVFAWCWNRAEQADWWVDSTDNERTTQ